MRANSTITDETVIYIYDDSGNILRKVIYDYTTADTPTGSSQTIYYTYDTTWKDKLVSYNGTTITYDAIGNPLTYGDNSFTWNGRRMATFSNGTTTTSYKYNEDGVRTSKTVGTEKTEFFVDGTTILAQKTGNVVNSFYYDANGKRIGFKHNGYVYYYVYNLQGDVTHILNSSGGVVGEYTYDAWGNITNLSSLTSIARQNPFRYRGYYYDTESGLYYLNSRYYNPEWGRFINADNQISMDSSFTGMNLFAYCGNNPINAIDPNGNAFMFVTAAIGAVAGAVVGGIVAAKNGSNVWAGIGIGAAAGGLVGLGAGAAAGVLLAGSATASTAAVITGGQAFIATVSGGGIVAGGKMIVDNISQAVTKSPQVFWSGGDAAKNAAKDFASSPNISGKTLEMTNLGQYLESINANRDLWKAASANFANVANNTGCSVYSIQNSAGVSVNSIWATVEYGLLSNSYINYGVLMPNGTIQFMS